MNLQRPIYTALAILTLTASFAQDKYVTDSIVSVKKINGWNRIVTSSGISLLLPTDWKLKMVTGKGINNILDVASSVVAKAKYTKAERAEIEKESGVRLMALAPINKQIGFAPNLNIIRDSAISAGGMPAEIKDLEAGLQKTGAKILAVVDVVLPSGPAKRISYTYPKTKFGPLLGLGYLTSLGKWSYLLTFTVPGSMLINMKSKVEQMAMSFKVVSVP